ncbi:uracil-DNA glycosylase [Paraburkholderia sp. MMS20-SJTN17]|uniref:Uracil-DNA glycosylase n=1 Tax=Paraburkholderia translucens TaxID=2886945 RepID=A0ABS8KL64_9BURK|nr:uracil-DNA glycosylase [Paraburkholderia sp. MMS20-SJTN17]MCC8405455.1 uracil-DNA glycosylase [Paraburkholderia sp. MMS20-SJTN17]
MIAVRDFVQCLVEWPRMANVFNPWSQTDARDQPGVNAPLIRQQQLAAYLQARRTSVKMILIAEALSCRGGRFTGVAMTSERILLGNDTKLNGFTTGSDRSPLPDYLPGPATRTSCRDALSRMTDREYGVYERTASVVWLTMLANGFGPTEFALWNAFPFHPFANDDPESNRRPSNHELQATGQILTDFISLFPRSVRFVALGREAESALRTHAMQPPHELVRHPTARAAKPASGTIHGKARPMGKLDEVIRRLALDR